MVIAVCDDGNRVRARLSALRSGATQSCGCLRLERATLANTTHGGFVRKDPAYSCWRQVLGRCRVPSNRHYWRYGAKGIRVCDGMLQFGTFIDVLGQRPSRGHSVDRWPNNAGSYTCGCCADCVATGSPRNVRWATQAEQLRNTSLNVNVTVGGIEKCAVDWSSDLGGNSTLVSKRIKRGWTRERAATTAVGKRRHARMIEVDGAVLSMSAWDRKLGRSVGTTKNRIASGMSPVDAVTKPSKKI